MPNTTTYGDETPRGFYNPENDVIAVDPEPSAAGNIILRAGTTIVGHGWEQRLHIVLTPAEAQALADELTEIAERGRSTAAAHDAKAARR